MKKYIATLAIIVLLSAHARAESGGAIVKASDGQPASACVRAKMGHQLNL